MAFSKVLLNPDLVDLIYYPVFAKVELYVLLVVLLGVVYERLDPLAVDYSKQVNRYVADKHLGQLGLEDARPLVLVVEGKFK